MQRKRLLFGLAGGGIAVAAVAVAAFWYFVLRSEEPPPVSLEAAAPAASGQPASGDDRGSDLSGLWTIASGSGSFAGYRVNENLVTFGAKTAVGRTQGVQGTLRYDGRAISDVQVTADLTGLKSDQSLRDDTLKMQAIQSCQFPTATFALTSPITLDGSATGGGAVSKTVDGNLTLHGVTRPVSIDVKGKFQNGQAIIVGSTDINFSDYSIRQPQSFLVVSLDDHGTMEFQLTFTKASPAPATATPAVTPTPSGCGRGFPPGGGQPPAGNPPGGGFPGINTPAPAPPPVD